MPGPARTALTLLEAVGGREVLRVDADTVTSTSIVPVSASQLAGDRGADLPLEVRRAGHLGRAGAELLRVLRGEVLLDRRAGSAELLDLLVDLRSSSARRPRCR